MKVIASGLGSGNTPIIGIHVSPNNEKQYF
jgi:hypothetical protein